MRKVNCDRCGRDMDWHGPQFEWNDYIVEIKNIYRENGVQKEREFDLCRPCQQEIAREMFNHEKVTYEQVQAQDNE